MDFQTQITIPKAPFTLNHTNKILLLGSCFTENIGKKLSEAKFRVDINPFGALYNAHAIASAMETLTSTKIYTEKDLISHQGLFHSMDHHSRFSNTKKEQCIVDINKRLLDSRIALASTDYAFITLGTRYTYYLKETKKVVSNCHKLPEKQFIRIASSVDDVVEYCQSILSKCLEINSNICFIFTVSPIRHWKDGASNNQLSKATLLLAIEQLQKLYPKKVTYFPAFEIMMDELRDYRFYASDMIHPSETAVEYIWELFSETYFTKETKNIIQKCLDIKRALCHKPFNPSSEQHRQFMMQTLLKVDEIKQKFPYFEFDYDIEKPNSNED